MITNLMLVDYTGDTKWQWTIFVAFLVPLYNLFMIAAS